MLEENSQIYTRRNPTKSFGGETPVDIENAQLDYENRRFGRSRRGRRMNRFERKIATLVLSKLPSSSLVIDVPCGLGRFSDIIIQQGHQYVGIDLNLGNARYTAKRLDISLPTIQASILELPLGDNSADFVFSIRMFHHFTPKQIERAFQEISRVAPQSLITFYNRRTWRIQRRRFSLRIRLREWRGGESWDEKTYSVHEIAHLAQKAGLRIKEKIPSSSLFTANQFLWLERI
jgi:SAM-dependent methyltransferase